MPFSFNALGCMFCLIDILLAFVVLTLSTSPAQACYTSESRIRGIETKCERVQTLDGLAPIIFYGTLVAIVSNLIWVVLRIFAYCRWSVLQFFGGTKTRQEGFVTIVESRRIVIPRPVVTITLAVLFAVGTVGAIQLSGKAKENRSFLSVDVPASSVSVPMWIKGIWAAVYGAETAAVFKDRAKFDGTPGKAK